MYIYLWNIHIYIYIYIYIRFFLLAPTSLYTLYIHIYLSIIDIKIHMKYIVLIYSYSWINFLLCIIIDYSCYMTYIYRRYLDYIYCQEDTMCSPTIRVRLPYFCWIWEFVCQDLCLIIYIIYKYIIYIPNIHAYIHINR